MICPNRITGMKERDKEKETTVKVSQDVMSRNKSEKVQRDPLFNPRLKVLSRRAHLLMWCRVFM